MTGALREVGDLPLGLRSDTGPLRLECGAPEKSGLAYMFHQIGRLQWLISLRLNSSASTACHSPYLTGWGGRRRRRSRQKSLLLQHEVTLNNHKILLAVWMGDIVCSDRVTCYASL